MDEAESVPITVVPVLLPPPAEAAASEGGEQAPTLSDAEAAGLFRDSVQSLVEQVFDGRNGAVVAYGDGLARERAQLCMPGASCCFPCCLQFASHRWSKAPETLSVGFQVSLHASGASFVRLRSRAACWRWDVGQLGCIAAAEPDVQFTSPR